MTDNEALIQALRNLWPLLSPDARTHAITIVNEIKENE